MKRAKVMTSSPESRQAAVRDDLPPALSSMWRLCKLGYRHEAGLLPAPVFLRPLGAVSAALPRQGDDRARGARGPAAGVGGDHRSPGASRLPRPALYAAQPGVR